MTYWFEVIGENSDLCGEEFFVEVESGADALEMAWDIACENFPDEELKCYGAVTSYFAEMAGLDTY